MDQNYMLWICNELLREEEIEGLLMKQNCSQLEM